MFTKILSLVMVMSIFTSTSFAASNDGLKAAFEDLEVALTVEGDMSNEAYVAAKQKEFAATVEALGVSNDQLISFVKSELNEKASKDLDATLAALSVEKMSQADAREFVASAMSKSYDKGASYRGVAFTPVGFVILVIVIVIIAKSNQRSECRNTGC